MIKIFDTILRDLLLSQVPGLTDESQVRFDPPDDAWRTYVSNLVVAGQPALAINIYMVDLRENRRLRSNERAVVSGVDFLETQPAPGRVDCHYLLSAWSPAQSTPMTEPTIDEHNLLYAVLAVLMNAAPFNPSRIYPPGSADLLAVPELIRSSDLPTQVAPLEGFPKLFEFWATMGTNHRHKPAIHLAVTLPVVLRTEVAGPMVTTRVTSYPISNKPETVEVEIQIGGRVFNAGAVPPAPLAGAWVQIQSAAGDPLQETISNGLGQFTFLGLRPGNYRLAWRAPGFALPAGPRSIQVPSPTGEYDLSLA